MATKTMIYIVRHGETDWNAQEKIQGKIRVSLNKKGREQAESIARQLKNIPIDAFYVSPLARAVETASIIAKYHPHAVFTKIPELKEQSFGDLEGKLIADMIHMHPAFEWEKSLQYPDFHPGNGESLHEIHKRVSQFVKKILKTSQGKTIIIVSHAGTLRILIGALLGIPIKDLASIHVQNASLTLVEYSDMHGPTLHVSNYIAKEY